MSLYVLLVFFLVSPFFAVITYGYAITFSSLFQLSKLKALAVGAIAAANFVVGNYFSWYLVFEGVKYPLVDRFYLDPFINLVLVAAMGLVPAIFFAVLNEKKVKRRLQMSMTLFLWGTVSLLFALLFEIFLPNTADMHKEFHFFNGHLKSLCQERENRAECPKNETQLQAFSPDRWQRLEKLGDPIYTFNQEEESYYFAVDDKWSRIESTSEAPEYFNAISKY